MSEEEHPWEVAAVLREEETCIELAGQLAEVGMQWCAYMAATSRRVPRPFPIQEIQGRQWLEIVLRNERKCYDSLRMFPSTFHRLHRALVGRHGLVETQRFGSVEALGLFLWACGSGESCRKMRERFCRSLDTVSRKFHMAVDAMFSFASELVVPRSTYATCRHVRLQPYQPYFDGCIGALDGTHIKVKVPTDVHDYWVNRKGYTSQNLLAICDLDMRFLFVGAGKSGACHDSYVLQECKQKPGFPFPPPGKYYLGDAGYALKKDVLTPYRDNRYHLKQFQQKKPTGLMETFNCHHSKLRNVIERGFGVVKQKWQILDCVPEYSADTQSKIIIGCFALHNFLQDDAGQRNANSSAGFTAPPLDQGWLDEFPLLDDHEMVTARDAIAAGVWSTVAASS